MDRETLSNYGWAVILIIILVILLSVATPVAGMIRTSVKDIVTEMDDPLPDEIQTDWPIL